MNFLILDLEATCWQGNDMNRRQEIIELAAFHVNGFGDIKGQFQSFVRPTDHPRLSAYCLDLTGIRQEQVDKARRFDAFIHTFQDWLDTIDHPQLLCTWGAMDRPLIRAECQRHDIDPDFLPPGINLKAQYTSLNRLPKEPGLVKALEDAGIAFEGSQHRALDDAYNTTLLFLRYLDRWQY
jgi:inhibitor of KinA sporulation pathway (predicted exonuclease)